jgi:cytochrome P450
MSAVRDAYGDVATFDLGPQETYMVSSPKLVQQVLVAEPDRFRKPKFQSDAMEDLLGNGLLLSEGMFWQEMRQLAQPAFAPDRINELTEMMATRAERLVDGWSHGDVRDVEVEMATVTVEIIVDAMFGTELGPERTRIVQENLEPLGRRFEPDPRRAVVPDWLPTPENRQYHAAIETLEGVIDDIVAERTAEGLDGDDLLSILLRARDDGQIDDKQVRDEAMTMLLAGHDTTALTLTYALYLLSENPEAERRLQEEIDDVIEDKPGMGDIPQLEYTRWVLDEAMRLYPPVYTMFRQPTEDVELGGYAVPEGSLVMLPQWAIHRDPENFEDPETFRPERWESPSNPQFSYFPFGAGPRSCIGKRFSLVEATMVLATIADQWTLDRVDDGPLDLRGSLTMHPADGMEMRIEHR